MQFLLMICDRCWIWCNGCIDGIDWWCEVVDGRRIDYRIGIVSSRLVPIESTRKHLSRALMSYVLGAENNIWITISKLDLSALARQIILSPSILNPSQLSRQVASLARVASLPRSLGNLSRQLRWISDLGVRIIWLRASRKVLFPDHNQNHTFSSIYSPTEKSRHNTSITEL